MSVSVVIPVYNGEQFLEQTICSVINQTIKPKEIIVHDDNSTDSSKIICDKYSSEISYYLNSNGPSGFVNGWNKAIGLAKGDYISILHQDDILYETFIEEVERVIAKRPDIHHIFAINDYINENNDIITKIEDELLIQNDNNKHKLFSGIEYVRAYQKGYPNVPHIHRCPGVVTHRNIFENYCIYEEEAGHIADDDFFYKVGQYTDVIGIMKALSAYRVHVSSETGRISDEKLCERLANDYLFQLKQWNNSDFIKGDEYEYFKLNASKHINRLLGYGFKYRKLSTIKKSHHLSKRLKSEGVKNCSKGKFFIFCLLNIIYTLMKSK